jgi:pfkB family carbohydrate kinase
MGEQSEWDVIVVSTCTIDRLPLPEGGYREIPGGPGTYTTAALADLGRSHRLITGIRAVVEVIRHADGEEYVIPALPFIPLPERLQARAVILSPIMCEIDVLSLPYIDGLVAVDLQGFVREPSTPSRHVTKHFDLTQLLRRSHVVKASTEEVKLLSAASRKALDKAIVVETQGVRGALLHRDGIVHHIPAVPLIVSDTIGAGDTYLAAFVASMIEGAPLLEAGSRAARFTENWLRIHKNGSEKCLG